MKGTHSLQVGTATGCFPSSMLFISVSMLDSKEHAKSATIPSPPPCFLCPAPCTGYAWLLHMCQAAISQTGAAATHIVFHCLVPQLLQSCSL